MQDVQRLPEQQRSALLMRELDGLSYAELADALDTSVPAIKSLLVRARVGLVEAGEARDAACVDIRADLARAHGRGVRASGRSRRHLRDCDGCREYRQALRGVAAGLAALVPGGAGPLAAMAKLLGIGGASSGAAAGAGAGRRHGRRGRRRHRRDGHRDEGRRHRLLRRRRRRWRGRGAPARAAVAPSHHAARHVRKAAAARAARSPRSRRRWRARIDPVRDVAARGVRRAPAPPTAPRPRRRRPPPSPHRARGRERRGAGRRRRSAAPEEAQTGGTMAPDEGSMPDEAGSTGAAGAPDEPDAAGAATPGPRPPATAPAAEQRERRCDRAQAPRPAEPRPADRDRGARALSSRPAMDRYQATLEHEQLLVRRGTRSGLYCIVAVHSTVRGPGPGRLPDVALRRQPRGACATRCACRGR